MNIIPVLSSSFKSSNKKTLKPLAKHEGPILQLTKEEQLTVSRLEESLVRYELEEHHLHQIFINCKLDEKSKWYYNDQLNHLEHFMEKLREEIRNIKILRYKKQMTEFLKKCN